MKKLVLLLAVAFSVSMFSCGGGEATEATEANTNATEENTEAVVENTEATEEATADCEAPAEEAPAEEAPAAE